MEFLTIPTFLIMPAVTQRHNTSSETPITVFLRPSAYDPDRKWESTTTTNLGLDFAFLNNRISGSVDYYKKTKDLLSVVPVAAGGNFNIELYTNVGNMENKGIEFTLNTVPVKKKNLTWDFGFNFTYTIPARLPIFWGGQILTSRDWR